MERPAGKRESPNLNSADARESGNETFGDWLRSRPRVGQEPGKWITAVLALLLVVGYFAREFLSAYMFWQFLAYLGLV